MKIGIDARLLERKITGIGRSLNSLLKELPGIDKDNKYFLFTYSKLRDVDDDFFINVSTVKCILPQKIFSPIWVNLILPKYLKKYKINLFFSINQLLPLFKINNVRYISVLHDVLFKVDKSFHPFIYRKYLQFFTYFSVKLSDVIITVSEHSKHDILKYFKVDDDKIKVVYQAAEREFLPMNLSENEKKEIKKQLGFPERIVFYLGMIENRKNIMGIIKIADEVFKHDKDVKFLLIGKIGHGGMKLLNEIRKRENIIHLMKVDDPLLKKIYNIAYIFLFPSFYEGFGYPPLEAMQCGLPVLASNSSSLNEIVDSAGILHNANDYQSFADDILLLLRDKILYQQLRNKGIERANKFNVTSSVKEIVQIFNTI